MVSPCQVGDIVRSFVRVPGSGSINSSSSSVCDLSRVSPLAASVSVPQSLPRASNATLMPVHIPNADIHKLKEENELLIKENQKLKKMVSIFRQLILNRERLNSVLRRLDECNDL